MVAVTGHSSGVKDCFCPFYYLRSYRMDADSDILVGFPSSTIERSFGHTERSESYSDECHPRRWHF